MTNDERMYGGLIDADTIAKVWGFCCLLTVVYSLLYGDFSLRLVIICLISLFFVYLAYLAPMAEIKTK